MNEVPEQMPMPQPPPAEREEGKGASLQVDWDAWLKQHRAQLFPMARKEARSVADAEEIMQEALMKLVQAVEGGSFVGEASGWPSFVRTTICRLAVDRGRREETRARYHQLYRAFLLSAEIEYPEPWLQSSLDDDLLSTQIDDLLRTLPAEFAEVVQLRIWKGYTFQQIADQTFTNLSTVASRYRYAMRALRRKLADNPLDS